MRKFTYKISFFLPILLLIILVNYIGDASNIFGNGKYEIGIADLLNKGYNVSNLENYDERYLQKHLIENLSNRNDVVILGSSRVMMIGENFFSGTVMNNAVSGATIEDNMAIYWMYRKKGILPQKLIIGLDPWLLNDNNGQDRYLSLEKEYREIESYLNIKDTSLKINNKNLQIFSLSYFQKSFEKLTKRTKRTKRTKSKKYYGTYKVEVEEPLKLRDGRVEYDEKTRNQTQNEIENEAKNYSKTNPIYSLGKFNELSETLKLKLEKFIELINEDKVGVLFILPPYHPIVYDEITQNIKYNMVLKSELYYREISKHYVIYIYGSYNPRINKLESYDFLDGMHPKEIGVKKFITKIPD